MARKPIQLQKSWVPLVSGNQITEEHRRPLEQLVKRVNELTDEVDTLVDGGTAGDSTITIDSDPNYSFGALYYASSPTTLKRLPAPALGVEPQMLYANGGAPFWGPAPEQGSTVVLFTELLDQNGGILFDQNGYQMTDQEQPA